jgi:hypothetical protein
LQPEADRYETLAQFYEAIVASLERLVTRSSRAILTDR